MASMAEAEIKELRNNPRVSADAITSLKPLADLRVPYNVASTGWST